MSDEIVVHIGENSPEKIAYIIMQDINNVENYLKRTRAQILDLYAECIQAVRHPADRLGSSGESPRPSR